MHVNVDPTAINWLLFLVSLLIGVVMLAMMGLILAGISLLIAVIVVGVLMRGKTILETAQVAVNTSFLVGFGLLLQVDLYYWLHGLDMDWYLPNLQWGFKYYLDLLQLLPTGLMALFAPLIAIAVKVVTDRIPLARPRPVRVSEE